MLLPPILMATSLALAACQGREDPVRTAADLKSTLDDLRRIAGPCDQAAARAAETMSGRASPVEVYMAAEIGASQCGQAADEIEDVKPPRTLATETEAALRAALKQCAEGYHDRALMLDTIADVANGDRRPSQVALVKMFSESSREKSVACLATMVGLTQASGSDPGTP